MATVIAKWPATPAPDSDVFILYFAPDRCRDSANDGSMDRLSITTGCLALLSAVGKTSLGITTFIRGCREARADLTAINLELSELSIVLVLLQDNSTVNDNSVIPESLQKQIVSIITNYTTIVAKTNNVLEIYTKATKIKTAEYVVIGKSEIAGLYISLEVHRGSLNLVLELLSVSISRVIKEDTDIIQSNIIEIKYNTSQILQIIEELEGLRSIIVQSAGIMSLYGQNYIL